MIDAYTIGITLSLDDEISQGLTSIRNELIDVNRIVDASTAGLIRLRQIAQSSTELATAEAARLATLAARASAPAPVRPAAKQKPPSDPAPSNLATLPHTPPPSPEPAVQPPRPAQAAIITAPPAQPSPPTPSAQPPPVVPKIVIAPVTLAQNKTASAAPVNAEANKPAPKITPETSPNAARAPSLVSQSKLQPAPVRTPPATTPPRVSPNPASTPRQTAAPTSPTTPFPVRPTRPARTDFAAVARIPGSLQPAPVSLPSRKQTATERLGRPSPSPSAPLRTVGSVRKRPDR